jgi:hypothetical protein
MLDKSREHDGFLTDDEAGWLSETVKVPLRDEEPYYTWIASNI